MIDSKKLLNLVRNRQKEIENFVYFQLISRVFNKNIRHTRHFRGWFQVPMNYPRIMELPLTLELLSLKANDTILDISSPKLLSLYLAFKKYKITISDIENYFVDDFKKYSEIFTFPQSLEVFDARKIPHESNTFDKVFSVSVLEHIPDFGDIEVVKEVGRVLKPGGCFVFTLPAYHTYLEEWLKKPNFYWQAPKNEQGESFYQRRYNYQTIQERFQDLNFEIYDVIFIAENPIKEPRLNDNGMLMHNTYYIEDLWQVKLSKRLLLSKKPLLSSKPPLLPYLSYRWLSKRYHYLTRNPEDKNIRQVALKLLKKS